MRKVAINGLGRIGRQVLRHLMKVPHVQVVAVNDLTDAATLAHLMKFDSVHGPAPFPVAADGTFLVVDGRRIRVYAEKDPSSSPSARRARKWCWSARAASPSARTRPFISRTACDRSSSAPRPMTRTRPSSWA